MANLRPVPILLVALPTKTLDPGPRFPATNQLIESKETVAQPA